MHFIGLLLVSNRVTLVHTPPIYFVLHVTRYLSAAMPALKHLSAAVFGGRRVPPSAASFSSTGPLDARFRFVSRAKQV